MLAKLLQYDILLKSVKGRVEKPAGTHWNILVEDFRNIFIIII